MNIIKMFAKNEQKKNILIKLKTENRAAQTSMTRKQWQFALTKLAATFKKDRKNSTRLNVIVFEHTQSFRNWFHSGRLKAINGIDSIRQQHVQWIMHLNCE